MTFELHAYRTLWGCTESLDQYIPSIFKKGYHGVETGLLFLDAHQKKQLPSLLKEHHLDLILTIITFGSNVGPQSVQDHFQSYQTQLEECLAYQIRPSKINVQGGVDTWSHAERLSFYHLISEYETQLRNQWQTQVQANVAIVHETHRSKVFFHPTVTLDVLKSVPSIRLNCDLSHWVLVCERMLDGEEFKECMAVVVDRCDHVHARVATTQQIQVADPREAHVKQEVDAMTQIWVDIWKSQKKRGLASATVTPEYGPPPYCPVVNGVVVCSLDQIVDSETQRLKDVFSHCEWEK